MRDAHLTKWAAGIMIAMTVSGAAASYASSSGFFYLGLDPLETVSVGGASVGVERKSVPTNLAEIRRENAVRIQNIFGEMVTIVPAAPGELSTFAASAAKASVLNAPFVSFCNPGETIVIKNGKTQGCSSKAAASKQTQSAGPKVRIIK